MHPTSADCAEVGVRSGQLVFAYASGPCSRGLRGFDFALRRQAEPSPRLPSGRDIKGLDPVVGLPGLGWVVL